jgi:hypothetical protein
VDSVPRLTAAEWSAAIIARGRRHGTVPRFGSPEWKALPSSDPRFVASVALAAERWRDHCSPERIAWEMSLELLAARQVEDRRAAEDFAELAAGVRHLAMVPTREVLAERRGQWNSPPQRGCRVTISPTQGNLAERARQATEDSEMAQRLRPRRRAVAS